MTHLPIPKKATKSQLRSALADALNTIHCYEEAIASRPDLSIDEAFQNVVFSRAIRDIMMMLGYTPEQLDADENKGI